MRNLKRVLSLGMTAAMITGLMVVGTSAASYADVSTEDNVEAISVLEEVGIMVGDENGDFNPDQLVTRNEMAVVMSNLMDYRAEPYVAACWTNGITAGTSATTYGGDASVTTAQAALMLMKALGYFQYSSDFGNDWQLSTVSQGSKIGLFNGVEAAVTEAMTRNDVAQMVLNTLESGMVESGMVEASSGSSITVGDIVINNNVEYNYVTSSEKFAVAISDETPASSTSGTAGAIVELGEKLYDGDLKKDDKVGTQDNFGRPGVQWRYKTTDIGTFAKDTEAVYTAKASKGDLYSLLGNSMVNDLKDGDFDFEVYYNGDDQNAGKDDVANYFDRNNSAAAGISGKGVVTEVYVDDDNDIVTLVFINTYVMQADADYDEDRGDLSVTTLTGPATVNALEDDEFDVADYMEDDYIIYTYSEMSGEVETIEPAEVVSGEVTSYSQTNYVTLDGTKYEYAAYIEGKEDESGSYDTTYVVGDTASIVLDPYGYVIYVDDASISVGNYVYVSAVAKTTGLSSNVNGDAYFSDGTNEEITIKKINNKAVGDSDFSVDPDENTGKFEAGWYSYTIDSNDKYTLKLADTSVATTVSEIQNGKTYIGSKIAGNSDTIFLVEDDDNDITVYTGIANVPDITSKEAIPVVYMQSKDDAEKAASLVYVDATNATIKDSTTDSLLYLLKLEETKVDSADGEPVEVWTAIVDGKVTTVETKENWDAGDFYENYSIDSDGYYEAGDDFTKGDDKDVISVDSLSYSGGTLTINGSTYVTLSDTQIVLVMRPDGSSDLASDIMKDADADYEVRTPSGSALANLFKGYTIDGKAYITYADDKADTDLATVLYIEVTGATEVAD